MIKGSRYIILGFVIAIVTVISSFFILKIEQIPLYLCALAFLIISMIVSMSLFVGMIETNASHKEKVIYNTGTMSLVVIYLLSVIISLFFIDMFENKLNQFIFLEVLIIAIFSILMLLINYFSSQAYIIDKTDIEKKENKEYDVPKRGGF